jgi:AcrR family transcriptional regulator
VSEEGGEVDRAMKLLWGGVAPRSRGPRPAHSLDAIADAAIALADAEGLAAVTMQRLAERLGFTKMALYRYVPGRAELVAVMVERALGPPPAPAEMEWRGQLRDWALAIFAAFRRHPWCGAATTGGRPIGPVEAGWMEAGLVILRGLPLAPAERLDVLAVVTGHTRALAQQAGADNGGSEVALSRALLSARDAAAAPLPELYAALAGAAQSGGQDQALTFGLELIFDGLDHLLAARKSSASGAMRS